MHGAWSEVKDDLIEAMSAYSMVFHYYTDLDIELAPDLTSAKMRCNVMCPMWREVDGELHKVLLGGSYKDDLTSTPDGWRFTHRVWTMSWGGTLNRKPV